MKVAYATIVYKNRRQNYYLFLYKPQISGFFFAMCDFFRSRHSANKKSRPLMRLFAAGPSGLRFSKFMPKNVNNFCFCEKKSCQNCKFL